MVFILIMRNRSLELFYIIQTAIPKLITGLFSGDYSAL